ncbi:hypothetical protein NEOLEDRAFT_271670 [Neolentinus lepideus HHB14362 ss-1]|uniref:Uncharacterized protein n=1 Tax=Neolentinus lepideus HHB14362 ss-1 TaxID=1314782 RepID=A0A165T496_9AGAM|nr:hypothetical protein NEOLEDRAFT_271670 [Neolentinus lepideus HHB14362 ss-1]
MEGTVNGVTWDPDRSLLYNQFFRNAFFYILCGLSLFMSRPFVPQRLLYSTSRMYLFYSLLQLTPAPLYSCALLNRWFFGYLRCANRGNFRLYSHRSVCPSDCQSTASELYRVSSIQQATAAVVYRRSGNRLHWMLTLSPLTLKPWTINPFRVWLFILDSDVTN